MTEDILLLIVTSLLTHLSKENIFQIVCFLNIFDNLKKTGALLEKAFSFGIYNRAPQVASINRGQWRCVEISVRKYAEHLITNTALKDIQEVEDLYQTEAAIAQMETGEVCPLPYTWRHFESILTFPMQIAKLLGNSGEIAAYGSKSKTGGDLVVYFVTVSINLCK